MMIFVRRASGLAGLLYGAFGALAAMAMMVVMIVALICGVVIAVACFGWLFGFALSFGLGIEHSAAGQIGIMVAAIAVLAALVLAESRW